MNNTVQSLHRQLVEAEENLQLVQERKSEYVSPVDIPLQLIKDERRLERRIRYLKRRLNDLRPINVLRDSTKLIVGPVAQMLTGEQWKEARGFLLTRASKLPRSNYLDTGLMNEAVGELVRLNDDLRILLSACRIELNPGQLEALEHCAGRLARCLIRIYRLEAGDAPELELLAATEGSSLRNRP
ncbi:MAG: hypothetical protein DRI48_11605 [Chloroflexi bacterium]|nr:MAG: hypothetical protein DRI48_11605 [Chloroflexota bacterium]